MSFIAPPSLTFFRLDSGAVECDEDGLRIAGFDLLEKQVFGTRSLWRVCALSVVENGLARAYGHEIDASQKLGGLRAVATALDDGDICLAQIAALLLRLPNPFKSPQPTAEKDVLGKTLHENGWLLKNWNPDLHPRAGAPPNPGWFAPTDSALEATSHKPGFQTAQADGAAAFLPPDDPVDVRKRIADAAKSQIGSTAWADAMTYGPLYRYNSNKCFLFVRDMTAQSGADPGSPNTHYGLPVPPFAGQWGDPDFRIPGWRVLGADETPEPGDIVAQRLGYNDASGHVMIVGDDNTFIGTGSTGVREHGTIEQIPARNFLGRRDLENDPTFWRAPLVFRRWEGR